MIKERQEKRRTACFVVSFTPGGHEASPSRRRWRRKKLGAKSKEIEKKEFGREGRFLLDQEGNSRLEGGLGSRSRARFSTTRAFDFAGVWRERLNNRVVFWPPKSRQKRRKDGPHWRDSCDSKDSRNSEGSVDTSFYFFLSDQWTMMRTTRGTERPSGRRDHDQVTRWSKWPRPLFNPIRTRVYSWMPSRLVWKKCLSFTFYLA